MADSKPNLNLIHMVQRARMMHDAEARPSQMAGVYWIEVKPEQAQAMPTARAGSWVIETTLAEVDALWAQVKQATQAGKLGYKSKVSTSPGPGQAKPEARAIMVCTVDAEDKADVQRVRDMLESLGLAERIQYQSR